MTAKLSTSLHNVVHEKHPMTTGHFFCHHACSRLSHLGVCQKSKVFHNNPITSSVVHIMEQQHIHLQHTAF